MAEEQMDPPLMPEEIPEFEEARELLIWATQNEEKLQKLSELNQWDKNHFLRFMEYWKIFYNPWVKTFGEEWRKIIDHHHDRAKNYSNLLAIAGYIGFFTLWAPALEKMPVIYMSLSGFFITASIFLFVISEVFAMKSVREREYSYINSTQNHPADPMGHWHAIVRDDEARLAQFKKSEALHFWPSTIFGSIGALFLAMGFGEPIYSKMNVILGEFLFDFLLKGILFPH